MLEKKPFKRYDLNKDDKKKLNLTLRLNNIERAELDKCKPILEQSKDSTAIKQLAFIGAKVIQEKKTALLLSFLFKNKHNNKRTGIVEFE